MNRPVAIVLDDFHHFLSGPVSALLARVVQYQPENLHLVISTRVDPPLPVAKWRVRNWIVEIRAAELVELNLGEVLEHDLSRRTLRRWLDRFPAPAFKQQPALAVALV